MAKNFVRMETGEELPAEIVEQVEQTADDLSAKIVWRKCDVLMIDNRAARPPLNASDQL